MIDIDVGLLWQELQITGEIRGRFALQWSAEPDGWIEIDEITGDFSVQARPDDKAERFGIRIAEILTPDSAEALVEKVKESKSALDFDIIEAGRVWKIGGTEYDNRVWWPVIRLDALADAEPIVADLRKLSGFNPLGLTVVRLNDCAVDSLFELTIGEQSIEAINVRMRPLDEESHFVLHDVPVGRGFHWEHKESFEFRGELRLFQPEGRLLTAVNRLPLETYLESTVGSEMRSDLPPAFSQAQAIAARSTVLATANRHHRGEGFDVCNDDHCQCYHGVTREDSAVAEPVRRTAGQALLWENRVVDARYAKSCGGVSEFYESVWGPEGPDYFAVRTCGDFPLPDLTDEHNARAFLNSEPACWCNPALHPYPKPWDEDTLFQWEANYTPTELGELVYKKTGVETGSIHNLRVQRRGKSGRIQILSIEGSVQPLKLFGELNIRRALSESHLPSSFFVADFEDDRVTLKGGGWGHGVGLCQLGAVAMANNGKTTEQILAHYYPGAKTVST